MAQISKAEEFKSLGNKQFAEKDYKTAAVNYTKAIKLDPENHVLYSNRSASFLAIFKYQRALDDAEKTIELKEDWLKGYFRKVRVLQEQIDIKKKQTDQTEELKKTIQEKIDELTITIEKGLNIEESQDLLKIFMKYSRESYKKYIEKKKKYHEDIISGKTETIKKEQVNNTQTNSDPLMTEESLEFSRQVILEVQEIYEEFLKKKEDKKFNMPSQVHLLPSEKGELKTVIQIDKAFDDPEMNEQCTQFLRSTLVEKKIKTLVILAQKSKITYPKSWVVNSEKFPFEENQDGIFVQVESLDNPNNPNKILSFIHFVPINPEKDLVMKKVPTTLNLDIFHLMEPLFSK